MHAHAATFAAPLKVSLPEEVLLIGRAFAPESINPDAVVRCASCGLVDPTRRGHVPADCIRMLREELTRVNALLVPSPRASSE